MRIISVDNQFHSLSKIEVGTCLTRSKWLAKQCIVFYEDDKFEHCVIKPDKSLEPTYTELTADDLAASDWMYMGTVNQYGAAPINLANEGKAIPFNPPTAQA